MAVLCGFHYGGVMEHYPLVRYVKGKMLEIPFDLDRFSIAVMKKIGRILGYVNIVQIYCKLGSEEDFEEGITRIGDENDALKFVKRVKTGDIIQVYLEHGIDTAEVLDDDVPIPLVMKQRAYEVSSDSEPGIDEDDVEGDMPPYEQTSGPTPGVVESPIEAEMDQHIEEETSDCMLYRGRNTRSRTREQGDVAEDPFVVAGGGHQKHCGRCGGLGHYSKTCQGVPDPVRFKKMQKEAEKQATRRAKKRMNAVQRGGATTSQPTEHVGTSASGRGNGKGTRGRGRAGPHGNSS